MGEASVAGLKPKQKPCGAPGAYSAESAPDIALVGETPGRRLDMAPQLGWRRKTKTLDKKRSLMVPTRIVASVGHTAISERQPN